MLDTIDKLYNARKQDANSMTSQSDFMEQAAHLKNLLYRATREQRRTRDAKPKISLQFMSHKYVHNAIVIESHKRHP